MMEGTTNMDKDERYDEAVCVVVATGQASISYLQRRLRINFSHAARLLDQMEANGVVSPAAIGRREVLVDAQPSPGGRARSDA